MQCLDLLAIIGILTTVMEIPETGSKITALISSLEALPTKGTEPESTDSYSGVFSNDLGLKERIDQIISAEGLSKPSSASLRVGFVVGSGGLLSLGKELPQIDLWVVFDKNANLIKKMSEYCQLVLRASGPQEITVAAETYGGVNNLRNEQSSFGPYHYLGSPKELEKAKKFLLERKIVFVTGDLIDSEFMEKFGTALGQCNAEIVFANLSNVMEWFDGFYEGKAQQTLDSSLAPVPFSPDCVFLFSVSLGRIGRSPLRTQVVEGLSNYLAATAFNKARSFSEFLGR